MLPNGCSLNDEYSDKPIFNSELGILGAAVVGAIFASPNTPALPQLARGLGRASLTPL
jgi:hypothetical protein